MLLPINMIQKEKYNLIFILLIIIFLSFDSMSAQQLFGSIIDRDTNQPLKGVHIVTTNNLNGAFSDENGNFSIALNKSNKIRISHIGYVDQIYKIEDNNEKIVIYLKSSSTLLNDVELGITKNKLANFSQSASISTLSESEIEDNISRSLAESMMYVPGVWMQKTNHGGGSPFVRGLTGNYVLLLVDGIRMNNSTFRYGPNQYFNTVSPFSVKTIEVLRGAGSTLYGSDAIGGTININTLDPSFDSEKKIGGSIGGQMMSHDMEYTGNVELNGNFGDFAFITNGSIREFGDSYAGEGIGYQRPSGYTEKDFMFKVAWQLKNNSKLTASYQWLRQDDVPRYDKVAQKGYEYYNFSLQQRQLAYLRYDKKWTDSALESFQITYSYQQSNEERDTKKNDHKINKNERDDISTHGLAAQLDALIFNKIEMVSGIDFYYDYIKSSREFENVENEEIEHASRGLYPDGSTALTTGFYNAYLYNIHQWIFQAGWRYNYTKNNSEDEIFGNLDQSSSSLVWNASVNYKFDKSRIYASLNSAFRAPNISDITSFGDFDYGIEVPAPDLKSERSTNYELGYKYENNRMYFNTVVFYTHIDDLIARVRSTHNGEPTYGGEDVYKKANVGEAYVKGVEIEFYTKLWNEFSLQSSMTYTYGKNVSKNEPFRRIPPLFGDLSLRYDHQNFFIILQSLAAGKQDQLSSGDIDDHRIPDGGTPGWFVANIKSGYTWNRIQTHIAFNNIFNEAYRMHGSGVDGLGRHVAIALKYYF